MLPTIMLLGAAAGASGKSVSIMDLSSSVQKGNVIRVSRQACDECATMEDFYASYRWVSVLFFERFLMSTHKYKEAIVQGFYAMCQDLRWSLVVCGVVDMLDDKVYAERYIDPKTAPANIVVSDGNPVPNEKFHIDRLLKKPGDKDTMLWHLKDLLVPWDGSALDTSVVLDDALALDQLLKKHRAVIVAAVDSGNSAREAARTVVRRLFLGGPGGTNRLPTILNRRGAAKVSGSGPPKRGSKSWRKWSKSLQRRRIVVVMLHGAKALAAHGLEDGQVVGFLDGLRHTEPRLLQDTSAAELLTGVIMDVVHGAGNATIEKTEL